MKGFNTVDGYMGLVDGKYILFASESDYYEYMNDLRKLVSEYGKIGSNLNQIAKHFNSGGSQSRAIENEIHQCITDLFLLRKEVLKLAGGMNGNRKTH